MKRFIIIFITFFITANILFAQTTEDKNLIKKNITKIFTLCSKENFEQTVKLIAYNGQDSKRKYKDFFNLKVRKEKSALIRAGKKIKALLKISDKYDIITYKTSKNPNIIEVSVQFKSGTQTIVTTFEFTKLKKNWLLAEIN